MLVGDCMTRKVYTLQPEQTVADGLRLMSEHSIHRLPVVDRSGDLTGIVSDMDLRIAEAAGRLANPVSAVMTRGVVTATEYTPIEEAAALMREKAVGGLPVVRGRKIIGIITEGDIFGFLAHLLGLEEPGVRLTLALPADRQVMLDLLHHIGSLGGDIVALGTVRRGEHRLMILKVANLSAQDAQRAVEIAGVEMTDLLARERG